MMKKVSRNKGMQGKLMNQMGINPGMMGGAGGLGGMGGLPAGMDLNSLKGMDMKKLQELAKRFK